VRRCEKSAERVFLKKCNLLITFLPAAGDPGELGVEERAEDALEPAVDGEHRALDRAGSGEEEPRGNDGRDFREVMGVVAEDLARGAEVGLEAQSEQKPRDARGGGLVRRAL